MYSTTRDRALAAAAATEHVATYGAPMPVRARQIVARAALFILALVAVSYGLPALVDVIGHALDVEHCQSVVDSFTGPTDHPEAVRCVALLDD